MQTTSATWKSLWASGEAMLETRAIIADVAYTQMTSPTISRALTQDGLSIGNAVAASCQFSVLADAAAIPKAAPVRIEMRLRSGDTMSEWLPAGTFYISHRSYDPVSGVLTVECFDALLRANADAPNGSGIWVTDQGVEVVTNAGENIVFGFDYPQTTGDMVAKIAALLGVTPDPRNVIASGTIEAPANGTTLQDILKKIGTLNGGNWIISPANQLRLVPVVSAANAASASGNVVDLLGITQGISARSVRTITGVRYTEPEAGTTQVIGTEQGLVVSAGEVTAAQAQAIYTRLQGMTYQAYALSGAIYDPAAELGDYVRGGANGEIRSVLYSETAMFSELFHADISAPESGELADEYPYLGASAKALNEAKNFAEDAASEAEEAAKSYADDVASGLDQSLDQTAIFNRLTNNGQAQGMFLENGNVYFNATYINTGTLAADRIGAGTIVVSKFSPETQAALLGGSNARAQYYLSTSADTPTGGSWLDTMPDWSNGKYVWTRTATTVTKVDGTSATAYSAAVYDANLTYALNTATGAASAASTAQSTANSAQSAASTAQTTANNAQTAADNAQSTADSATTLAQNATSLAAAAQTTANGKITTYYQAAAPSTANAGDLWIDTDDGNKLYRWNGTSWVSVQDSGIQSALVAAGDAQATADSKVITFAQASQPTAADTGDLWIDTDDGNKLYRWNNSAWVDVQDEAIATAQSTAASALSAASAAQSTANTASSTANSATYRSQLIYISRTSAYPAMAANTSWVTDTSGAQNTWTAVRPQYSRTYPVLFVALQRQTSAQYAAGSGTCYCTTPVVDQTTTVIDGGHITTGTIDAGVASIININASNINTGTLNADLVQVYSQNNDSLIYQPYSKLNKASLAFGVIGKLLPTDDLVDIGITARIREYFTTKYNSTSGKYDLLDAHNLEILADRAFIGTSQITLTTTRSYGAKTAMVLDSSAGITAQMYSGPFAITGDFTVSGTKSRVVDADQYSDRLLYAYETASPLFGDVGEGVIGDDGRCYIFLDPIFAQAVESDRYQVFLQAYGYGRCYVLERHPSYFIVAGLSEMAFGWEVKARQRGYEAQRMESAAALFSVPQENYGDAAADYIETLQKGMIL